MQLLVVIWRTALQRFRDFYPTTIIDITLLLGAAIVVGLFHGTGWTEAQASSNAVMAMTTLATLTGVTFLRTFTKVPAKLRYGTNGSIPHNESPHCHNAVLVCNASIFQHVPVLCTLARTTICSVSPGKITALAGGFSWPRNSAIVSWGHVCGYVLLHFGAVAVCWAVLAPHASENQCACVLLGLSAGGLVDLRRGVPAIRPIASRIHTGFRCLSMPCYWCFPDWH
jgi:hypothetical protein